MLAYTQHRTLVEYFLLLFMFQITCTYTDLKFEHCVISAGARPEPAFVNGVLGPNGHLVDYMDCNKKPSFGKSNCLTM